MPTRNRHTSRIAQFALLLKKATIAGLLCAATAIAASAQTFTDLVDLDYSTGAMPQYEALIQGPDGNFYGTTEVGGPNDGFGTAFKMTPTGTLTVLYNFGGFLGDGLGPYGGLVLGTDGNFYGTTAGGGAGNAGTVFKLTPAGKETILHSFDTTDGRTPVASLIQANNGKFYGITEFGGANLTQCSNMGCGTIFEITSSGAFTSLYSFCSQANCTDGAQPFAPLMQASNGELYGTANMGGTANEGTVFEITTAGAFTSLHSFTGDLTDGAFPQAGLIQATNGLLYGTTSGGGNPGAGAVYQMTLSGQVTLLASFDFTNGVSPTAGVVQATDGNFYGTTFSGGNNFSGNIYQVTPSGTVTSLYSFCSQSGCPDGQSPEGGLVQGTNGTFYGTTLFGGTGTECGVGCGVIYSLSMGLGPFVKFLPASGKVGQEVGILGNNLKGATSVTFNGTAAKFTVPEPGVILTHVPSGATSGYIKVTDGGKTLVSNVPFQVVK